MKRLFLFAAIMLSVQVSAQSLSKEEAKRLEEQRVAKAMLSLKKYAVNDTIKISVQDIESLTKANPSVNIQRPMYIMESNLLYDIILDDHRIFVDSVLSLRESPKKIDKGNDAWFVIEALNKMYGYDISNEWDKNNIKDSLINFLDNESREPISFLQGQEAVFKSHHRFDDVCIDDPWEIYKGAILVFGLGKNKLHFAIAISESEIIHDLGNGLVIENKAKYEDYIIVQRYARFAGEYQMHCNEVKATEVVINADDDNQAKGILNAILEVLY